MAAVEDQTVEGYSTHVNCLNGVDSVKRNAPETEILTESLKKLQTKSAWSLSFRIFDIKYFHYILS